MIKDFISSLNSYLQAIKIIKKLNLWKYFLIPIGFGLILGGIFIFGAYSFSDDLGALISNFWKWDFLKNFIVSLSSWISGFTILLLGILLYKHILMILSAPFMTPVSEKVERYLTGKDVYQTKSKSEAISLIMRSLKLNVINLSKELLLTIPLIILSFIPFIGLIATFYLIYFQSYYTGFGNLDYTLERHLNYSESEKFVKKHKGIAIGNGLVFTFMLFIPFIGVMLTLPIATVAATIDSVKKLHSEEKLIIVNN